MKNQIVWKRHPKAELFLQEIVENCCDKNSALSTLKEKLKTHTSTNLFNWVDHVTVSYCEEVEKKLDDFGFINDHASSNYRVFSHPGANLPRVVILDNEIHSQGVAIKVESISDFLMVHGLSNLIEGTPFSSYRRAVVSNENDITFWVIERRNANVWEPKEENEGYVEHYIELLEKWSTRPRIGNDDEKLMDSTLLLASELASTLGENLAAWIVFEAERKYWQSKNLAGQVQKNRQDRLGLGWANHDHHTFRSSRKLFPKLVRLFEILGFHPRERFYAGQEASWGAQVMENSICDISLFLDLDLTEDEIETDFTHHNLSELKVAGTVGLWCQLHGDSILKGGLHHIAGKFNFANLTEDLTHYNISMMEPFSDFSYLLQAFTHGEIWPVDHQRINRLLQDGKITQQEADKFLKYGAIGSHLENLERAEGYKGFNQKNVTLIIQKTDPRKIS